VGDEQVTLIGGKLGEPPKVVSAPLLPGGVGEVASGNGDYKPDQYGKHDMSFQAIYNFTPDECYLSHQRNAERLKTMALKNQAIGAGLDAQAYFGGEAEKEWTRDANEYVQVAGSLLSLGGNCLQYMTGPETIKAQAKDKITTVETQAKEFKPQPFDWNPLFSEDHYQAKDTGSGWVTVSQAQKDEAKARFNKLLQDKPDLVGANKSLNAGNAWQKFYQGTATAMNQSIMTTLIQAKGADERGFFTLGVAVLKGIVTIKGQWDSENADPTTQQTQVVLPDGRTIFVPSTTTPGGTPAIGGTGLAGVTPAAAPANALAGTAAALASPSLGNVGGAVAETRPGPVGGLMGAPPGAGRGSTRRNDEDPHARLWEVTEEDGEIWGAGTIGAIDGGVLA
jgi:hypothetical protein